MQVTSLKTCMCSNILYIQRACILGFLCVHSIVNTIVHIEYHCTLYVTKGHTRELGPYITSVFV